jgi:Tfp pilus assembly pilus retraction ATPase PilT/CheY-like chemotaxis protein
MQIPLPVLARLISRFKVLGEIDISKRLSPQDGRARVAVEGKAYDLRISTVPSRGNEKAVIRVLDPYSAPTLENLGLPPAELQQFKSLLSQRDGIVLVTGPTGSGKTTTLYGALQALATPDVNIVTVEDPVEYEFPALTQIQVEPKQGVTFASALRAILRQDPDIILVGEIRDKETAEMAVQAALTGHLVLATLHTNDAIGAIRRLADLGLDRPSIVSTVRGSLAQRLVRKSCTECDGQGRNDARQCEDCGGTGYRGRFAVVEVFTMSERFEQLILDEASPGRLLMEAEADGMRTMRRSGLDQVDSGLTTLAEVNRVLGGSLAETVSEADGLPAEPLRDQQPNEAGHILLVDDDAVNRTMARALLEKQGFRISEAADGEKALQQLDACSDYSLMVLDLDMPRMGGREVLAAVRGRVATAGLPVVVLTGTQDPDAEIEVMRGGADDYIRKPIDPPRFIARVSAALRRARG